MSGIVCALRGGQGSLAVRQRAIQRARERDLPLTFLSIIDLKPFAQVDEMMLPALASELAWMTEVLARLAMQQAQQQGVEAHIMIRKGDVATEINRFLRESEANLLLLGAPRGTTANVFGDDAVEQFAVSIQNETGVPVEIARPEQI
ncbi:MAG: universal stress protein [Anaerolineales bacterium]|nr:universal stress protein [Anaerolineales bacterium]MCB0007085.1 universal stress protein [Anaerolineales bacterium]MCB8962518.1 universal stress protein [Ardenticatenales bacterium]